VTSKACQPHYTIKNDLNKKKQMVLRLLLSELQLLLFFFFLVRLRMSRGPCYTVSSRWLQRYIWHLL
jgi:hypothetical protein